MTRIAVFAYGSLVDPASAGWTLAHELPAPRPARLEGWRRRWTLVRDNLRSEKTFAITPSGEVPRWVLGLNIEPQAESDGDQPDEAPNGALLELSPSDLDRLDLREMRYDRVEVTGSVAGADGFDLVVAYRAKPRHHAPTPPPGAVILATYVRAVEQAFERLGAGEREGFLRSTPRPPVELVEPMLVRDRIPPGNPRAW